MNDKELKVGIAYPAFFGAFERHFPQLEPIDRVDRISDISKFNLIIFSGGEDINPRFYREKNKYCGFVNDKRDNHEKLIFNLALTKTRSKILGVCRGHQLINALLGGFLVQDIKTETGNSHPSYHDVDISRKTDFSKIFKRVNSMHHQGVIEVGRTLYITSRYRGLVESTENDRILSVQYHPEFMDGSLVDLFFEKVKNWALDNNNNLNYSDKDIRFVPNIDEMDREDRRREMYRNLGQRISRATEEMIEEREENERQSEQENVTVTTNIANTDNTAINWGSITDTFITREVEEEDDEEMGWFDDDEPF